MLGRFMLCSARLAAKGGHSEAFTLHPVCRTRQVAARAGQGILAGSKNAGDDAVGVLSCRIKL
jgi:hypothetical protein